MNAIRNPILPGFNPDPSICHVGDDYYIATSTFEWVPGVQIHHSRDLVNWGSSGGRSFTDAFVGMVAFGASGGEISADFRHFPTRGARLRSPPAGLAKPWIRPMREFLPSKCK
jgi:beta-xylosidase